MNGLSPAGTTAFHWQNMMEHNSIFTVCLSHLSFCSDTICVSGFHYTESIAIFTTGKTSSLSCLKNLLQSVYSSMTSFYFDLKYIYKTLERALKLLILSRMFSLVKDSHDLSGGQQEMAIRSAFKGGMVSSPL